MGKTPVLKVQDTACTFFLQHTLNPATDAFAVDQFVVVLCPVNSRDKSELSS